MREELAELCHRQWVGWMKYLFSKSIPYKPGEIQNHEGAHIVPKWAVDRWQKQMNTPYNDLSEDEKESDRKEADKFLWAFVVQDPAHMYRALQLMLGFIHDTPWYEVSDQDVQSWIEAAKELEHES